jgi:hypothetical protein
VPGRTLGRILTLPGAKTSTTRAAEQAHDQFALWLLRYNL